MENIYTKLKEGYAIAKTPEQIAKVREWEYKIDARVANMNRMLAEILKPDPRWEAYKKRNGIK